MLILLPPSEGKAPAVRGAPLDLARLSLPELTEARERVLDALLAVSARPDAATVLGLGPGQAEELGRNARLRTDPAGPAAKVYTGVLYEALDLASLPSAARAEATRSVLVSSGLWGAVRLRDRIPAYRCSIGVSLPGIGALATFWRRALAAALDPSTGRGFVLDLRSSAYATTWSPPAGAVARTATVRVLHERVVRGTATRTVVSHFNKATKGRLVRELLVAGARPRTPAGLAATLRDLGYRVEEQPAAGRRPAQLDIVVTEPGSSCPGRALQTEPGSSCPGRALQTEPGSSCPGRALQTEPGSSCPGRALQTEPGSSCPGRALQTEPGSSCPGRTLQIDQPDQS